MAAVFPIEDTKYHHANRFVAAKQKPRAGQSGEIRQIMPVPPLPPLLGPKQAEGNRAAYEEHLWSIAMNA